MFAEACAWGCNADQSSVACGGLGSLAGESAQAGCEEAVDTVNAVADLAGNITDPAQDMGMPEQVAPSSCGGFYTTSGGVETPQNPSRSCSNDQLGLANPPACWHLPCLPDPLEPDYAPDSTKPVGQPGTLNCATGQCDPNPPLAGDVLLLTESEYLEATQTVGDTVYTAVETAESAPGDALVGSETQYHTQETYTLCKAQVAEGVHTASNCPAWGGAAVQDKGRNFETIMLGRLRDSCLVPPLGGWRYRTVEASHTGTTKPSGRLRIADAFCPDALDPGPGTGTMHEFKCLNTVVVPSLKRQTAFLWQAVDYFAKVNFARCEIFHGRGRDASSDAVFGGPPSNVGARFAPIHLAYHFCDDAPAWALDALTSAEFDAPTPAACLADYVFNTPGAGGLASPLVAMPADGSVPAPPVGGFIGTDGTTGEVCQFGYVADDPTGDADDGTPRYAEVPDADFECDSAMVPEAAREVDCASEHYDRCDNGG